MAQAILHSALLIAIACAGRASDVRSVPTEHEFEQTDDVELLQMGYEMAAAKASAGQRTDSSVDRPTACQALFDGPGGNGAAPEDSEKSLECSPGSTSSGTLDMLDASSGSTGKGTSDGTPFMQAVLFVWDTALVWGFVATICISLKRHRDATCVRPAALASSKVERSRWKNVDGFPNTVQHGCAVDSRRTWSKEPPERLYGHHAEMAPASTDFSFSLQEKQSETESLVGPSLSNRSECLEAETTHDGSPSLSVTSNEEPAAFGETSAQEDSSVLAPMEQSDSDAHSRQECKPCAYFWAKTDSCRWAETCEFCHLCDKDAVKRRKKEKKQRLKREAQLAKEAAANEASRAAEASTECSMNTTMPLGEPARVVVMRPPPGLESWAQSQEPTPGVWGLTGGESLRLHCPSGEPAIVVPSTFSKSNGGTRICPNKDPATITVCNLTGLSCW